MTAVEQEIGLARWRPLARRALDSDLAANVASEAYGLAPFAAMHAFAVAQWAQTADLRWLAPNTCPPLTAAKVLAWNKGEGEAFVLLLRGDPWPHGYGELNRMSNRKGHFWIGHIVVRPDRRRRGFGAALVRLLLARAFEHRRADRVSLIVFPDNRAAIRCYDRVGFVKTGEERHPFAGWRTSPRLWRMEMDRPTWERRGRRRAPRARNDPADPGLPMACRLAHGGPDSHPYA